MSWHSLTKKWKKYVLPVAAGAGAAALIGGTGGAGAGALLGGAGAEAGAGASATSLLPFMGAIGGSALSAYAANQATKKQIEWERERATNAHQWEIQDLQNAGLNPILSAGGQGATTGGISAPVPDFSGISNIGNAIQAAATTKNLGEQNLNLQADREATKANTALTLETVATQRQKTITEMKNQGLIDAQTAKTMTEKNLTQTQMQKIMIEVEYRKEQMQAEIDKLKAEAEQLKANKKFTEAKEKETKANALIAEKESKAYWWKFTGELVKNISEEGRGWYNAAASMVHAVNPFGK